MVARMALGGFHLILDYREERDGRVNLEGHGVLGWDPRGKCYTMHWFDSMGVEHGAPAIGTWEGNVLSIAHETSHMGHSRQVYEIGRDEYRFRLESSRERAEVVTAAKRARTRAASRSALQGPRIATRPLWICPRCGNRFVNRNNWHSCVRRPLSHHFKGSDKLRRLWRSFLAAVRSIGPVRVVSSKTRLVVMARVRFAGVVPRKDYWRASIWLTRPVRSSRFIKVERIVPGCYVHSFELREPGDLDGEIMKHLRESYAVGMQQHLRATGTRSGRHRPDAGSGRRARPRP
jgi:hypothetical protein